MFGHRRLLIMLHFQFVNAFTQCFVLLNQVLVIPGDFFDHIRVLLVRLQLKSHINGLDRLVLSFSGAAYVAFALKLLI